MSTDDLPNPIDVPMLPLEHLPDIPECRVLATADPVGGIWFEITEAYARDLRGQLTQNRRQTPADELVPLILPMDSQGYRSLTKGLAQLHQSDEQAVKQVRPAPTAGDLAVAVFLNDSQIESSMRENYAALKRHGDGRAYGQKFGISHNGAVMLDQQLEAVLSGADDPLEAIDMDDDRFTDGGGR